VRKILRFILIFVLGVVVAVTAASVVYNLATSDPNVPVTQLWHGKFVDGTAYREWGSQGRPVVLLGGFLEPSFVWDGVAPILAARGFHVYALDLDGFGYTVRRGPWTLGGWGDQVQRFIQTLHLRKPIVAGHSLGAAVAVEEARRGVAASAVLVDGDALTIGGPPHVIRVALAHSPFFTTAYRVLPHSDWVVRRLLKNAYGPTHPALDATQINLWTDQFRAKDGRKALQGIAEHGIAGFTSEQLRATHLRALVIWGRNDNVDALSAGRQTAHDLQAALVVVPNAGHLSMITAAPRVAAAIARLR
jgi:pimeloyl-ACP methyl ester carboxylesterase